MIEDDELRGICLTPHENCETLMLLFDRDGVLRSPVLLDQGEETSRSVSVKTQYAPVEVHECLVKLLRHLQKRFFRVLEVQDEGELWESGDRERLIALRERIDDAHEHFMSSFEASPPGPMDPRAEELLTRFLEIVASLDADDDGSDDFDAAIEALRKAVPEPEIPEPEVLLEWEVEDWVRFFDRHDRSRSSLLDAMAGRAETPADFAAAVKLAEEREKELDEAWERFADEARDGLTRESAEEVAAFLDDADDNPFADAGEREDDEPWRESLPDFVRSSSGPRSGDPFEELAAEFPAVQRAVEFRAELEARIEAHTFFSEPSVQYVVACVDSTLLGIATVRRWSRESPFPRAESARWVIAQLRFATVARVLADSPVEDLRELVREAREISATFEVMARD